MTATIFVALDNVGDYGMGHREQTIAEPQFKRILDWISDNGYEIINSKLNRYQQNIVFKVNKDYKIEIIVDESCRYPKRVNHGYPNVDVLLEYLPQYINWCNSKSYDFGPYSW